MFLVVVALLVVAHAPQESVLVLCDGSHEPQAVLVLFDGSHEPQAVLVLFEGSHEPQL